MIERPPGWTRLAFPALIAVLVLGVFAPAFDASFVSFDDPQVITRNAAFRGLDGEHLAWMFTSGHAGHYQPLTWVSLALDHAAVGLEPGRYHVVNVVLHALTALALWFVAARLLALACAARDEERTRLALAALGSALFFAVHPLRVESVAWVTERRDVLSGLGFVLAVGAWLRWASSRSARGSEPETGLAPQVTSLVAAAAAAALFRSSIDLGGTSLAWGATGALGLAAAVIALGVSIAAAARITTGRRAVWFWITAALMALSLFAKAWGIVLPVVLLVVDTWPLGRLRRGRVAALLAEKAPLFALSFAFATLAAWAQASRGGTMVSLAEHGLAERAAQGLYGLAWYPWKTVAPTSLSVIYELPAQLDPLASRFLLPAVLVLGAAVALFALRRRMPGTAAAVLAFAVIVSPVLGVAQSGPQLVADRYSYLSCLPFALLFGGLLFTAGRRGAGLGNGVLAAGALALVALGAATHARTRAWQDSTALWEAAHAVDPSSPMALLNLGVAREEVARETQDPVRRRALLDEARDLLERGFQLDPRPLFQANLSRVHEQLAALDPEQRAAHRAAALASARAAWELASQVGEPAPDLRLMLGVALLNSNLVEESLPHLERYVSARPDDLAGLLAVGKALGVAGRPATAAAHLEHAVQVDPTSVNAWGTLAAARNASGDRDGAIAAYREVLRLAPGHPAATERLRGLGVEP